MRFRTTTVIVAMTGALFGATQAGAQSAQPNWDTGRWQFAATVYAYLPSIGGSLTVPADASGGGINIDASKLVDNLNFAFMGTLDAHNGRWGMFTDVLYLDVGGDESKTRDFTLGSIGLPSSTTADLRLDLKGWIWTVAGEYRLVSDPAWKVDALAGARLFDVRSTLGWSIYGDLGPIATTGRSGSKDVGDSVWDGIVGLKGTYAFGDNHQWIVPFYVDVGTGQSDLTWQGAIGLGYNFSWGGLLAMWRYLDYNFKSGSAVQDMNFNGPMAGVQFRW
jgi:hypothetical protein